MRAMRPTPVRCATVFLLAPLLLASACDEAQVCTSAGCATSNYTLTGAWTGGEYELEISYELGGHKSFVCAFDIGQGDAGTHTGNATCDHSMGGGSTLDIFLDEDEPTLHMYDAPDRFELELRKNDETLVRDYIVTPEYEALFPNGPDCGSCRAADMTILLANDSQD